MRFWFSIVALVAFMACGLSHADSMRDPSGAEKNKGSVESGATKEDSGKGAAGESEIDKPLSVGDVFGNYGYSELPADVKGRTCKASYDLDQHKFVEAIPDLQKIGLLNPDLNQTKINSSPNTIAVAFLLQMFSVDVNDFYKRHTDANICQFSQYMTSVDDYGNDKKMLVASFMFSRATWQKINWDKFEATKIIKVSQNFRYTPEVMRLVADEAR